MRGIFINAILIIISSDGIDLAEIRCQLKHYLVVVVVVVVVVVEKSPQCCMFFG